MRVREKDLSKKINHLSELVYDKVDQVYQFHQNRLASPYDGHCVLQRQIKSKTVHKDKDSD